MKKDKEIKIGEELQETVQVEPFAKKTETKERISRFRLFKNSGLFTFLYISLLIVFVILLSLLFLSRQSLRLDEAQSLWQSSRSPQRILYIIAQDVHVPLYHLVLHVLQQFFGNGVFPARMLSLFYFVLSIPAIYFLARDFMNRNIALFSTFMYSVSSFMNWYANEIRMYTQLTLLTILSQYLYLKIMREGRTIHWVLYVIVSILGMFTHYFFALNLVTQGIFFLLHISKFKKKTFRNFIFTAAFIVLSFSPWLMYVYKLGSASSEKPLLMKPSSVDLFNTYSRFIFGYQDDRINTLILSLWPLLVLLGFLAVRQSKKLTTEATYFLTSAFLPIVAVFLLSLVLRPFFVSRYLIISLPSLYIFITWLLSIYPPKLSVVMKFILIIGLFVTLTLQTVSASTPVKENYEQATQYLEEKAKPQDIIVLSAPFTLYPVEYYYNGDAAVTTIPIWDQGIGGIPPFDEKKLPEEVDKIKRSHDVLWLLLSYDQGYESKVKSYFDNNFKKLEEKNFSQDLNLYAYQLY